MNTGQVIQRLFDYGANILGRDEDGNQPVLYNAIENNDTEIINLLLEFGINYDDEGVIEHAIEYNNSQLIELFINRNDNTTSINETLLGWASEKGHLEFVKKLYESVEDYDRYEDGDYGEPVNSLILAAKNGHLDVFNFLYDNQQSIPCPSWLFENAIRGGNIGIVNRLLDLNFKIDFKDEFGDDETAVDTAAKSGHLEILLRILEKCPEKSTVGVKYVDRAFEIASKNLYKRRYTTVRRNYDSDSDSDDEEEENIINDYMKIVKKMIEIGANVNSNYVYTAALDGAVMSYDRVKKDYVFELINLLIDNGATVTNELITKVKNTEIKDLLKRAQRRGIKPAKA